VISVYNKNNELIMQLSYKSVSEEFRISRPFIHKTLCLLLDSQRSFLDTVFYALASEI